MLKDLVKKNRSYRGYDESYRFSRKELAEFVDYARLTPSSVNAQPFKYYLAWEKDEVDLLQSLTKWARALPELTLPHKGMCPTGFIVICQDMKIGPSLARYQRDVGIVAQTILLAATEKGLGGCMIGNFGAKNVREALKLSEDLTPMLIIALGKPAETIILEELEEGGSTNYYRDSEDRHHVPKRRLEDIVISRN